MTSPNMIIFSVALNGYAWMYKACIDSHRNYADRIGCRYVNIRRPWVSRLGGECCWLKISVLKQLLDQGHETVLVLDADTFVDAQAPDIRGIMRDRHHLYMAKGTSGEFNSGVMLVRNTPQTKAFFTRLLEYQGREHAKDDPVGWGENGHLITLLKQSPLAVEMGQQWNNTGDISMSDYIRHYNHGPLRDQFFHVLFHKLITRTTTKLRRLVAWVTNEESHAKQCLGAETKKIFTHYSF